ncbi:hypothetical protein GFL80_14980 [Rhizobium leguminosarum bv. viciae]|uniref:hypothetical protein n=1 Tax=Rhizobium leguminosarum TaxID=384 RepID=UPI0014423764|nr:hypothetical protein [Rhizobium leguminosarum]NKK85540.1 hypothetical protein [Rhizobium leguminosarum bv. viciae]
MMAAHAVVQVDPVLCEDGRTVGFYGWTDDNQATFWTISLPMMVEEDAFEDLLPAWRQLGWSLLMQQA